MSKVTKETVYDQLKKIGEFGTSITNSFGYGIVVDSATECVLWRAYYSTGKEHTAQRWKQIKWSVPRNEDQEARPYITIYGTRYYIDEFMRCA